LQALNAATLLYCANAWFLPVMLCAYHMQEEKVFKKLLGYLLANVLGLLFQKCYKEGIIAQQWKVSATLVTIHGTIRIFCKIYYLGYSVMCMLA